MADGADGAIPFAERAAGDLEALRVRLAREIRRLLVALNTDDGTDRLRGDRDSLATAVRVRRQVVALLKENGVRVFEDAATKRALEAAARVTAGNRLPANAQAELARIVTGQTAEVASVWDSAADDMRRAINAATTTGGNLATLIEDVAQALDTSFVRATAAIDAAVMASGRRALMLEAKATGLPYVYAYVGPDDGKIRDFCKQLVGRAVSETYMRRLDNGQGLPVRDFCGGYNCRHSWAPLLRADAIAEGLEVLGDETAP